MQYPKVLNLSLPKTGSTTIYEAFKSSGSVHEGFHDLTVDKIIDYYEGRASREQLTAFLKRRQKLLRTTLDSSTFMHLIAEELQELYPTSTMFICVIRHPCYWVTSYLSMLHEVGRYLVESQKTQDLCWTSRYASFQAKTLDPVRLYMESQNTEMLLSVVEELCDYWHRSITRVHHTIDKYRLISTPIEALPALLHTISQLLGVEPSQAPHANRNRAPQATQESIQRACEQAAIKSTSVLKSIDLYHSLIEK